MTLPFGHILIVSVLLHARFSLGVEPTPIEVIERSTVFAHPSLDPKDQAPAWDLNHGPSVTILPDGRVMAAWWTAPAEGAPSQRIMRAFSSDEGRTWDRAVVLQDTPNRADFDPALFAAGKDTFLFFTVDHPLTVHFRQSSDCGLTWTEPVDLRQPNHTTRSNGIQLSTGELLVPVHLRGTKAGGVMKSRDGGRTWLRFGMVANPDGQGGEPTIAETKTGKIHMMLRTKDGELWRSISADKGETWSSPEKTGLTATASASHLLCTRNGTLVLTLNPERTALRFPLVMRLSRDEGNTWSEPAIIADRPARESGWSVCYPSAAELADGHLIVIWTQIKSSPGELYGDICAARVRFGSPSAIR
jgi:predicted neuraminidase